MKDPLSAFDFSSSLITTITEVALSDNAQREKNICLLRVVFWTPPAYRQQHHAGQPKGCFGPAPAGALNVSIAKFAFAPATLTVQAGQTVTFSNDDAVAHSSTSDSGAWDSGELAPGQSFSVTLQQPGTYHYHCSVHPFMQATLIVQ